jgi:hypothetical protein
VGDFIGEISRGNSGKFENVKVIIYRNSPYEKHRGNLNKSLVMPMKKNKIGLMSKIISNLPY